MNVVVLIPSYRGDEKLIETIAALQQEGFDRIVVVNDGSAPQCDIWYEKAAEMGCEVLRHAVNMGKGRAMRTGFNHVLLRWEDCAGVVVCDADGQHEATAVRRAAELVQEYPRHIILAARQFFQAKVPLPNLLGNTITRGVFYLLSGLRFGDTQCGLRGFSVPVMKQLMGCYGDRFEFENTSLLELRKARIPYVEYPIRAVYEQEGKQATHFNRIRDSWRIYSTLFKFATLPAFAFGLSTVLMSLLDTLAMPYLWQALCALLAYLVMLLSMPARRRGGFAAAALLGVGVRGGLTYLLTQVLSLGAVGAWWLGALVTVPLGYMLWRRIGYGKVPQRVRLEK